MSRLCICREYEDMFTEGFKYVESLEKHDAQIRADERAKVLEKVLKILANEKWDYTLVNKIEQLKEQNND